MLVVSPVVLEYLRSEMAVHNWQHAIAVVTAPEAAIGLPRFRIILYDSFAAENLLVRSYADVLADKSKIAGRAEKIFVIVREEMRGNGAAEALLRKFVDYKYEKWSQIQMDGMVVYSQ